MYPTIVVATSPSEGKLCYCGKRGHYKSPTLDTILPTGACVNELRLPIMRVARERTPSIGPMLVQMGNIKFAATPKDDRKAMRSQLKEMKMSDDVTDSYVTVNLEYRDRAQQDKHVVYLVRIMLYLAKRVLVQKAVETTLEKQLTNIGELVGLENKWDSDPTFASLTPAEAYTAIEKMRQLKTVFKKVPLCPGSERGSYVLQTGCPLVASEKIASGHFTMFEAMTRDEIERDVLPLIPANLHEDYMAMLDCMRSTHHSAVLPKVEMARVGENGRFVPVPFAEQRLGRGDFVGERVALFTDSYQGKDLSFALVPRMINLVKVAPPDAGRELQRLCEIDFSEIGLDPVVLDKREPVAASPAKDAKEAKDDKPDGLDPPARRANKRARKD